MDNNNELNFFDVMKMAFKNKFILISITLIVAILGTVFVEFFINKSNAVYSSEFVLEFIENKSQTYPDGTKFRYSDIILKENLEKVKASKPNYYKNIDVEKMSYNNDIKIKQNIKQTDFQSLEYIYTLTINASYFKNKDIARQFINDLVTLPIEKIEDCLKDISFNGLLNSYVKDTDKPYEVRLSYLESQKDLLTSSYDSLIQTYDPNEFINNKTLLNYKQNIVSWFEINTFTKLKDIIKLNGYAPATQETIKEYELKISSHTRSKLLNEEILKALIKQRDEAYAKASSSNIIIESKYDDEIIALTRQNIELEIEINRLQTIVDNLNNSTPIDTTEIDNYLKEYYDKLVNFTDEFTQNYKIVTLNNSMLSFTNTAVATMENDISILLAGLASLVIGLICSCILNIFLCLYKQSY